jgi:small redox-active disulfide protein 2
MKRRKMMQIEILGMGCSRCRIIRENIKKAIKALHLEASIATIEDIDRILQYDILGTPALLINGELVSSNRVISYEEMLELLNAIEHQKEKVKKEELI